MRRDPIALVGSPEASLGKAGIRYYLFDRRGRDWKFAVGEIEAAAGEDQSEQKYQGNPDLEHKQPNSRAIRGRTD